MYMLLNHSVLWAIWVKKNLQYSFDEKGYVNWMARPFISLANEIEMIVLQRLRNEKCEIYQQLCLFFFLFAWEKKKHFPEETLGVRFPRFSRVINIVRLVLRNQFTVSVI